MANSINDYRQLIEKPWGKMFYDMIFRQLDLPEETSLKILQELARVLKRGGTLSVVKHNLLGRVMTYAVFSDNPKAALDLLDSGDRENNMFGKRDTYDDEYIIGLGDKYDLSLKNLFGIRTFFHFLRMMMSNLRRNGMTTCLHWK